MACVALVVVPAGEATRHRDLEPAVTEATLNAVLTARLVRYVVEPHYRDMEGSFESESEVAATLRRERRLREPAPPEDDAGGAIRRQDVRETWSIQVTRAGTLLAECDGGRSEAELELAPDERTWRVAWGPDHPVRRLAEDPAATEGLAREVLSHLLSDGGAPWPEPDCGGSTWAASDDAPFAEIPLTALVFDGPVLGQLEGSLALVDEIRRRPAWCADSDATWEVEAELSVPAQRIADYRPAEAERREERDFLRLDDVGGELRLSGFLAFRAADEGLERGGRLEARLDLTATAVCSGESLVLYAVLPATLTGEWEGELEVVREWSVIPPR